MGEQSYYESKKEDLRKYISLWKLSNLELLDDGRESCVLKCYSENYGCTILKKRNETRVIEDEYHALMKYNGKKFCQVFDANLEEGVLLEEQIKPGTVLRKESSLDKKLLVFCSLHKELHIPSSKPEEYPTYQDWVSKITRYMERQYEYKELTNHMKRAENICIELSRLYPSKMLLHGDLHHDNILLNQFNEYTIIDPKGVIGDPIFDIPRFILNEMDDRRDHELFEKINYIIKTIADKLNLPIDIIKQCFYVEMAMAECWNVESGEQPNINHVNFAQRILNS